VIEFLMAKWVEVVFALLCIACLLVITYVAMIYEEFKRKYEDDEFADLKAMMPKLPKEKKKK